MGLPTVHDLRALAGQGGICVSICMPASSADADPLQSLARLKSQLRSVRSQLRGLGLEAAMVQWILEPAASLLDDDGFWQRQPGGLAIYCAPGFFRVFRSPLPVPELATVAARFQLEPLLSLLVGNRGFAILALARDGPCLFLAAGDAISQIQMPRQRPRAPNEQVAAYFRRIDQSVCDILGGCAAPLILAGQKDDTSLYKQASSYPHVVGTCLGDRVDALSPRQLLEQALPVALSHFARTEERAASRYRDLEPKQLASSDLRTVLEAASLGRVNSLLVAAGVQIWGTYRAEEREMLVRREPSPEAEDLLNLAAAYTLMNAGEVYAIPPDRMPGGASLAATFRY